MSVLEANHLSIRFGGVQANRDVSVAVGEYEIVGIIGPNGAGKTTLFNLITGFFPPDAGTIVYKGRDITGMAVNQRAALGLGRTFQNVGLVKGATVRENLVTAQHLQAEYSTIGGLLGSGPARAVERRLRERADSLADVLGLGELLDTQVSGLPYGTLKRVEIATVLATDPDVLLLDEPSSGMGPEESHQLGDTLLDLRRSFGLSIVMIEHHVPLVVRVCDYVYCLDFGQMLAEGLPHDVRNHPQVVAAYLGEDPDDEAAPVDSMAEGN
ncbi:MAG: ABC transporter ATP-binding protein [Actinomycetota bacterium]|nr:ABC transporter ATP-binding protein [Actinomycetota bacterium]